MTRFCLIGIKVRALRNTENNNAAGYAELDVMTY